MASGSPSRKRGLIVNRGCFGILCRMTKLLEEVVRKVAELPDERQDDAAHVLLTMLENDAAGYRLTDAQLREVEFAMADADKGTFASDQEVRNVLHRPWA